jgi:virulence factor Mce-like protein
MKTTSPGIKIAALALLIVGALVILAYYYQTAGGRLPFAGHLYTVTAQVQDPQGLLKHADVRAAGVKVGTVSNLINDATPGGTITDVQMQLNSNYAPIYTDATVLVRQKTLVGENYIDISRGHPQHGKVADGGTLPLSHDLQSVPLDKILNALTPPVRSEVRTDLQSLGAGLNHEGNNLNQFLGGLEPTVYNGGRVLQVLNGQRAQLADVVSQTGAVMQAIANRTQDLQTLITAAMQTAQAVSARDTALAQGLVELPPTLAQARTSVATLASFSGLATPVIANLRVAVQNLDPVIHDLEPTAAAARRLFNDLPPFLRVANPLLVSLKVFSRASTPAVPALEALLRQADPALAYLKPYYREAGGFLENFGTTGHIQSLSHEYTGHCLCPISAESYSGYTPAEQALVQALIKAGALGGIANPTGNGLRQPGSLPNETAPFTGTYPHITPYPPTSLKP